MAKFRGVFRHIGQYGIRGTFGLIREKLFIDPKRFSARKKRRIPDFPANYLRAAMPRCPEEHPGFTVLYCLHYFYPKKRGGTERFTLNLAKEAAAVGNRALVLTMEGNEPESLYTERLGNILFRYYEYSGVRCIGFRYKKAPPGIYYKNISEGDSEQAVFAEYILSREGVDIVHATYPQPFATLLSVCRKRGLPYLVTCTDFSTLCHYSTMVDRSGDFCRGSDGGARCAAVCPTYGCPDQRARFIAAKRLLSGAALVTVPSEFVARVLSAEFRNLPILPIAHGISGDFRYKERRGPVKRFVYAGTLSPLKGVHLLIEAFGRLRQQDISLLIYGRGEGGYERALKRGADERVRFMGAADAEAMPDIFSSCDCAVIPSIWYETYNFSLREAMRCGALVVAADIGAMPEAIDEGKNGFLFEAGSVDALYRALCLALDFDLRSYKPKHFPSTSDEWDIYSAAYRLAISENRKKRE